ncbi:thioredoxin [Halobellus limi]|uniref:Thioredoxin n=1 Tax=Halobellus limi TaxID=699433 RepID=A0A1H5ZTT0_9EURY|nr:thioredoxin [Halobellus limi]QCC47947.1 thioredoxin [Halobellus limi]SEG39560.1 thioredoxin [Halobellus limi]
MSGEPTRPAEESTAPAEQITDEEAFDRLIASEERVLVDFYADWCGPCQLMAPTVDELAAECAVPVVKVDTEGLPQVAYRYDVQSIPTFLVLENGEATDRLVGMQNKETLSRLLE